MTQPLEPTLEMFASPVVRYVAATRPPFLTASLMACLVGLAAAWHSDLVFDIPLAFAPCRRTAAIGRCNQAHHRRDAGAWRFAFVRIDTGIRK